MQQCNCSNTYRYVTQIGPDKGHSVCVICGVDWPSHKPEVVRKAKELFHEHLNLTCTSDHYWDKRGSDYREAWLTIAAEDLEEADETTN